MALAAWLRARYDWLRARDLVIVAEIAALGGLTLLFLELGRAVTGLDTDAFDRSVLLALRHAPDDPLGPPWLENAMMHLSALGSGAVTSLIAVISSAFLALAGRWRYALLVVACAVGTVVAMELLKGFYERPRPTVVVAIDPPGGESFPSGHSMISSALYLTLSVLIARTLPHRRLRVFAVLTGVFLAAMVGFTRLYLGNHYPTDVIAGWTAGAMVALSAGLVIQALGRRGVRGVPTARGD